MFVKIDIFQQKNHSLRKKKSWVFHYVFNEMKQSSLICNLYGFGIKSLLIKTFLVKCFLIVLDNDMLH